MRRLLITATALLCSGVAHADLSSQYNQQQNDEMRLCRWLLQQKTTFTNYTRNDADMTVMEIYNIFDGTSVGLGVYTTYHRRTTQREGCNQQMMFDRVPVAALKMIHTAYNGRKIQFLVEGNKLVKYVQISENLPINKYILGTRKQ